MLLLSYMLRMHWFKAAFVAFLLSGLGTRVSAEPIQNPGFEQLDVEGLPQGWDVFRQAPVDVDATLARSGQVSVRSSFLFGWSQELLSETSPYQSFALTGYAEREFDFEQVRTRVGHYGTGFQYLTDTTDSSPLPDRPGYQSFWTIHETPPGAERLILYLAGRNVQSWIRYDNLRLYTEQLQTSGSEVGEPWVLQLSSESSGVLTMHNGSRASQRVVTGRQNQQYFIAGAYTATADTSLTVEEIWLPRGEAETTASTSADTQLAAGNGTFTVDVPRAAGVASGQSLVSLATSTPGTVQISKPRRGFAKVEPQIFTVGGGSPDKPLQFTAALPDELLTASVTIFSGALPVASLPVTLHGAAARATWDGATATSGTYSARFFLTGQDGDMIQVERRFTILRDNTLASAVPPLTRAQFTRCAWLFFIHSDSTAYINEAVRLAREDGFNYAMVQCRPDQFGAVRAALENEGLPYFVQSVPGNSVFGEYLACDYFSRHDYTTRLRSIYSPFLGSPLFQGVYVVDEPAGEAAFDLTRRANLAISQDPQLGHPFQVLTDQTTTETMVDVQPSVVMVDHYPFRSRDEPSNPAALLAILPKLNATARTAASMGRQFWLVLQAFWAYESENFRPVPLSMHRAQLGAAVLTGAKGVVPFSYLQISYIDGIRSPQLEPTRKHPAYAEFNSVMERIGPAVMSLATPDLDTRAPAPFAVSVAQTLENSSRYLLALNADDISTRTLFVSFSSAPAAPLVDIVSETTLPSSGGSFGITLGPGEWAMVQIGGTTIAGYSQTATSAPSLSTLGLPVTHEFTVRNWSNTPTPVVGLSFNPDASAIAASTVSSALPGGSHVFELSGGGAVSEQPTAAIIWAERRMFLPDGTVASASPLIGFSIFSPANLTTPVSEFSGHSGGAYNVLKGDSDTYWITMNDFGIRRISISGNVGSTLDAGVSESDGYRDIFGPFPDQSVAVLVRDTGLHAVYPGAAEEVFHDRAPLRRLEENASISSRGLVAAPRGESGVALFKLSAGQSPVLLNTFGSDITEAIATAWISDDVLAVADGINNVRFYWIASDALWHTLIGTFRPTNLPIYVRALASKHGKLAIGLHDGRVFVVDAGATAVTTARDWQLFE